MMGQNDCPFIYTETYMDQQTKDVIYGIVNNSADSTLLHNNANKASERIPVMRDMIAGEVSKLLALEELQAILEDRLHYHHYRGLNFQGMTIKGANFRNAIMRDADFKEAKLIDCIFDGAQLQRANFVGATMEGCTFRGADLRGVVSNASLY